MTDGSNDDAHRSKGHILHMYRCGAIVGAVLFDQWLLLRKRFMSKDEYVDAAIRKIMSQKLQPIITRRPEGVGYKYVHPIPYGDVSDFRAANPDCCKFMVINSGLQDRDVSFWDVLQGRAARSVYLKYMTNYIDAEGRRQSAELEAQLVIGNCGQIY